MGAADAHDARSPGGSRPKWGQLMLMMRPRQGSKAKVGAADAHDAGSPGGSGCLKSEGAVLCFLGPVMADDTS